MDPPYALFAAQKDRMVADWFEHEWQRVAFRIICEMDMEKRAIDAGFVAAYALTKGEHLDVDCLLAAERASPSKRTSAESLSIMLRREYMKREIEKRGIAVSDEDDPSEVAGRVAQELLSLSEQSGVTTKETIRDELHEEWENTLNNIYPGLPMPWPRMFSECGGPLSGHVCLLVSHGGGGKSYAFAQWALFLAEQGIPALLFPLEDGEKLAWMRIACMHAGVEPLELRVPGRATREKVDKCRESLEYVQSLPLYVSAYSHTVNDLYLEAQRHVIRHGVKMVGLDAFKDVKKIGHGAEGEADTINAISAVTKRLNVPTILSHHVRKPPAGDWRKASWHISQFDLLGSSNLWSTPRMVLALQKYPLHPPTETSADTEYEYRMDLLKSNHGRAGRVSPIYQHRPTMRWLET